jgi:hypothetical protein
MLSNLNDWVPRDQAKIPNVRNWAVRDYGIWRLMEVLTRYGIRASAALNSEVCDHHPEIIEEGGKLGWEWIGHNQTNALRLTEMDPAAERAAVRATIDRIESPSGTRPLGRNSTGPAKCCLADRGGRLPSRSGSLSSTSSPGWSFSPASVFASARDSPCPLRRRLHNDLPGHRADRRAGRSVRELGLSLATSPSSVVQTGVKSFGCENSTVQLSPIQRVRSRLPSPVSRCKPYFLAAAPRTVPPSRPRPGSCHRLPRTSAAGRASQKCRTTTGKKQCR